MYGGDGSDTIKNSGLQSSKAYGGDGEDKIDVIGEAFGGEGDDYITSHIFTYFHLHPDDPETKITIGGGVFYGEGGNDTINFYLGRGASRVSWSPSIYQATLDGGDGDDSLHGAGRDIYFGGSGNDTIINSVIRDDQIDDEGDEQSQTPDLINEATVYAGDGDDVIRASGSIFGESGNDRIEGDGFIYGGDGDDTLIAIGALKEGGGPIDFRNVWAFGEVGNDNIYGALEDDLLDGGAGEDKIFGGDGADTLKGQQGNDVLEGGEGEDILWGNDGEDILNGNHGTDWIKGGAGKDLFILDSRDGVDTIADFRTNEKIDLTTLLGGSVGFLASQAFTNGYIRLEQSGADTLLHIDIDGQSGSDPEQLLAILLDAQASRFGLTNFILPVVNTPPIAKDDFFTGQEDAALSGNVLIDNGLGADSDPDGHPLSVLAQNITTLAGGSVALLGNGGFIYTPKPNFFGNDSFEYTVIDGKGGSDVGKVSMSFQDVPEPGNPLFLSGDAANNTLIGGDFNDTLKGQAGDDVLIGNAGADTLWGNNGNDILYGGSGSDWMKGGDGADLFVLDGLNNDNFDTIADLRISGGDKIQIKDILSYDPVNDAISDFVRITQNGSGSVLSVDVDGSGNSASFALAAKIEGITGLDVNQLYNEGDLVIRHIVV